MRQRLLPALAGILGISAFGCVSEFFPADQDGITAVLGAAVEAPSAEGSPDGELPADDTRFTGVTSGQRTFALTGRLQGDGAHELFDLGPGRAGDQWDLAPRGLLRGAYVVALFDADMNLLRRAYVASRGTSVSHTLRRDTPQVLAGIMTPSAAAGGAFDFLATGSAGHSIPGPRPQIVWLNFGPGADVRVQNRSGVSFDAFDGAMLGPAYADATQIVKDAIVEIMRADYAQYNVTILSSDRDPRPNEPHSVVHFGGDRPGLLGLADTVDDYNGDTSEQAIVYVEGFALYVNMQLTPEEMAVMIANVASHELGHLLGLYHTRDPQEVMDITANAWELAEDQSFRRAPLEPTVFAVGMEDTPRILAQSVGYNAQAAKVAVVARAAKLPTYRALRRFAQEELSTACGTCLSLDQE